MKRIESMIIVAGMVLACGTMAMAADETITFTGFGDGKIGGGNNWSPDLGNNTVEQRRHFIVDNNINNNLLLDTNNTWLDDGTAVDPTDPVVGSGKWGGKSMELSGTGYVSYQALSKGGEWKAKNFRIGEVGVGFLNQSGGTLDLSPGNANASMPVNGPSELRIGGFNKNGVDWNGVGTYTMTGGLLTSNGLGSAFATGWVRLGEGGTGTMSIGGTAVVDLAAVQANGVVSTNRAAMTLSANVEDTGTNNALLEILGAGATVNIDTLAMMGGFTNTIKFDLDGGAVSPINVAGGIADVGGVGVYIADGGWIELAGYEDLAPGAVIDLINSANGFLGAENLSLKDQAFNDATLGLDGTGTILQATIVSDTLTWTGPGNGDWNSAGWDGGNPGDVPNVDVRAEVPANLVTLAADGSTHSLLIDGADAGVAIGPGATLSVAQDVEVAQGTLRIAATGVLDMEAGAVFADGSQLVIALNGSDAGQIQAGDTVRLETGSSLRFEITGKNRFEAGNRILINKTAEDNGVIGSFGTSEGLGLYVTGTGLSEVEGSLILTIDKPLHSGDANLDTTTDVRDFNVWNTNKFISETDWSTGDFNGDGTTDVRDFNVWNTAKFTSAGAAPAPGGQVPEPSTIALLAIALAFASAGWQRRRRRNW